MALILVVDDEIDIRLEICDHLNMEGYETIEAENGKTALDIARIRKPELILSDILMPEMDGFQFLKEIRKAPETKWISFIFMTVVNRPGDIKKGLDLGGDMYFIKMQPIELLIKSAKRQIELQAYRKQLEEKNRELNKSHFRINTLLKQRKRFEKIVVHDVNNPLTTVMCYGQMLKDDLIDSKQIKRADAILKSSDIMKNKIELLLKDFETEHEREDLNLVDLAEEKIYDHYFDAEKKGQKIEGPKGEMECIVSGNEDELLSAIDNLISNGIKFSPLDEVIKIYFDKDRDYVYLHVQDNGPGLTEEQIEKLKTDPTNVGNKPTGDEESHGIGLATTREIIEEHGGQLLIKSKREHGSTFTIKLPLATK